MIKIILALWPFKVFRPESRDYPSLWCPLTASIKNMLDQEQKSRNYELSDGFLRQRRNIILISFLMPLFFLSDATVEKINFFGTIILIESQSGIKIIIITLFIYFLWRYWQYYGEENTVIKLKNERKTIIYKRELKYFSELTHPKAQVFESNNHSIGFVSSKIDNDHQQKRLPSIRNDTKVSLLRRTRSISIYGIDERLIQEKELARKIKKDWLLIEKSADNNRAGAAFETQVEYNLIKLLIIRLKESSTFLIKRSYFTDFQLPFYIAISSLIVTFQHLYVGM